MFLAPGFASQATCRAALILWLMEVVGVGHSLTGSSVDITKNVEDHGMSRFFKEKRKKWNIYFDLKVIKCNVIYPNVKTLLNICQS